MKAEIEVPETSCGPGKITFMGPGNSIDVSLNCT
jgi:hypothetical protein